MTNVRPKLGLHGLAAQYFIALEIEDRVDELAGFGHVVEGLFGRGGAFGGFPSANGVRRLHERRRGGRKGEGGVSVIRNITAGRACGQRNTSYWTHGAVERAGVLGGLSRSARRRVVRLLGGLLE